jgi:uncharacterized protein with FMN-binding domain
MQKNNLMVAFAVFLLVGALTIGAIFYQNKASDSKQPDSVAAQPSTPANTQSLSYKDGTYSADGVYQTPDNQEEIGVTLTLKNNIITEANVEEKGILATSKRFQGEFISGYKPMVIGKNIDEVNLSKVSGSSLTPKGFNDALSKIKEQAKV